MGYYKMSETMAIFKRMDKNGDGLLDMDELTAQLSDFGMTEESIFSLFALLDKDGNGVIDETEWSRGYSEYSNMLRMPSLEVEILHALAEVRANPALCAERIKMRRSHYKKLEYSIPTTEDGLTPPVKMTKEGTAAVDDALAFLAKQEARPGFCIEQVRGLRLAGQDHATDVGQVGVASHVGSDGSGCWDRMSLYGEWQGACGECLWYGKVEPWVTGRSIIDDLVVDDGLASRGHRLAIFDDRYAMAGVALGNHRVYGNIAAIEFAKMYVEDEERVTTRIASGPPVVAKDPAVRKREPKTAWNLGKCRGCARDIEGGQVVEAGGYKWHKACFCCTQCQAPLAGVAKKKEEDGRVFCNPCWLDLYAKSCHVCNKKIDGEFIRTKRETGDIFRCKGCKKPAPAPKPVLTKVPVGKGWQEGGGEEGRAGAYEAGPDGERRPGDGGLVDGLWRLLTASYMYTMVARAAWFRTN